MPGINPAAEAMTLQLQREQLYDFSSASAMQMSFQVRMFDNMLKNEIAEIDHQQKTRLCILKKDEKMLEHQIRQSKDAPISLTLRETDEELALRDLEEKQRLNKKSEDSNNDGVTITQSENNKLPKIKQSKHLISETTRAIPIKSNIKRKPAQKSIVKLPRLSDKQQCHYNASRLSQDHRHELPNEDNYASDEVHYEPVHNKNVCVVVSSDDETSSPSNGFHRMMDQMKLVTKPHLQSEVKLAPEHERKIPRRRLLMRQQIWKPKPKPKYLTNSQKSVTEPPKLKIHKKKPWEILGELPLAENVTPKQIEQLQIDMIAEDILQRYPHTAVEVTETDAWTIGSLAHALKMQERNMRKDQEKVNKTSSKTQDLYDMLQKSKGDSRTRSDIKKGHLVFKPNPPTAEEIFFDGCRNQQAQSNYKIERQVSKFLKLTLRPPTLKRPQKVYQLSYFDLPKHVAAGNAN